MPTYQNSFHIHTHFKFQNFKKLIGKKQVLFLFSLGWWTGAGKSLVFKKHHVATFAIQLQFFHQNALTENPHQWSRAEQGGKISRMTSYKSWIITAILFPRLPTEKLHSDPDIDSLTHFALNLFAGKLVVGVIQVEPPRRTEPVSSSHPFNGDFLLAGSQSVHDHPWLLNSAPSRWVWTCKHSEWEQAEKDWTRFIRFRCGTMGLWSTSQFWECNTRDLHCSKSTNKNWENDLRLSLKKLVETISARTLQWLSSQVLQEDNISCLWSFI